MSENCKNMKNLNDTSNTSTKNTDISDDIDNDAVWSLLDQAEDSSSAKVQASPMFSRNVMREIRLQQTDNATVSLWQRIFSLNFGKVAIPVAAIAACAVMVTSMISDQNDNKNSLVSTDTSFLKDIPLEELSAYNDEMTSLTDSDKTDAFTTEILLLSDKDPFYITDEEIDIAMNL